MTVLSEDIGASHNSCVNVSVKGVCFGLGEIVRGQLHVINSLQHFSFSKSCISSSIYYIFSTSAKLFSITSEFRFHITN